MKFDSGSVTGLAVLAVIVAGMIGWVMNIVELVQMSWDPVTGMAVARAIGVLVAPLGAILGYF